MKDNKKKEREKKVVNEISTISLQVSQTYISLFVLGRCSLMVMNLFFHMQAFFIQLLHF
jgi:hypothetical protein